MESSSPDFSSVFISNNTTLKKLMIIARTKAGKGQHTADTKQVFRSLLQNNRCRCSFNLGKRNNLREPSRVSMEDGSKWRLASLQGIVELMLSCKCVVVKKKSRSRDKDGEFDEFLEQFQYSSIALFFQKLVVHNTLTIEKYNPHGCHSWFLKAQFSRWWRMFNDPFRALALGLWIVSNPPCLVTSDNLVKKILVIFERVQVFNWLSFNVNHFEYIFQKVALTLVSENVLHKKMVVQG